MIGLCSNTYIVSKAKTITISNIVIMAHLKRQPKRLQRSPKIVSKVKFSSKAVSRRLVRVPFIIFTSVLESRKSRHGFTGGFRVKHVYPRTDNRETTLLTFIVNVECLPMFSPPFTVPVPH